jgi:hypothetical protein
MTFGDMDSPLANSLETLSMVGEVGTTYDTNNNLANDQFSVDGATYTFDGIAVYQSTVTFTDGTSISYDIRIAQTTTGQTYILPNPIGSEVEQAELTDKPIASVTLNEVAGNDYVMAADRIDNGFTNGMVDGTNLEDNLRLGHIDEHGDQIDGTNNLICSGAGNDTIDGGAGNDTIDGGLDNDVLTGGAGNDTFVISGGNDTISDFNTGNTGALFDGDSTNNDFLDLSGHYDTLKEIWADQADDGILNQSNNTDTQGKAVDYSDNLQFGAGSLTVTGATADGTTYSNDNTGVVCFTPGTLIRTPSGDVPIERLAPGDLIVTRDNGVKPLLWVGQRSLNARELDAQPHLRPVLLRHEFFGFDRDLIVSPQHGVLLRTDVRGGDEILYRAIHLARLPGGAVRQMLGCRAVTYMHLLFDQHEVIFSNGVPSESLYPGQTALGSMDSAARHEVFELFGDLADLPTGVAYGAPARDYSRTCLLPDHLSFLRQAG